VFSHFHGLRDPTGEAFAAATPPQRWLSQVETSAYFLAVPGSAVRRRISAVMPPGMTLAMPDCSLLFQPLHHVALAALLEAPVTIASGRMGDGIDHVGNLDLSERL
jgi:hypothetical protein